jgi:hypothetical protein
MKCKDGSLKGATKLTILSQINQKKEEDPN